MSSKPAAGGGGSSQLQRWSGRGSATGPRRRRPRCRARPTQAARPGAQPGFLRERGARRAYTWNDPWRCTTTPQWCCERRGVASSGGGGNDGAGLCGIAAKLSSPAPPALARSRGRRCDSGGSRRPPARFVQGRAQDGRGQERVEGRGRGRGSGRSASPSAAARGAIDAAAACARLCAQLCAAPRPARRAAAGPATR